MTRSRSLFSGAVLAGLVAVSGTLHAEDLRPAPDYYVETLFAVSMAGALVEACSEVALNLTATGALTNGTTERLVADGFDEVQPFAQMIDPAPRIREVQAAFLETHPALGDDPEEADVCAVARAEMAADSPLGKLLQERAP